MTIGASRMVAGAFRIVAGASRMVAGASRMVAGAARRSPDARSLVTDRGAVRHRAGAGGWSPLNGDTRAPRRSERTGSHGPSAAADSGGAGSGRASPHGRAGRTRPRAESLQGRQVPAGLRQHRARNCPSGATCDRDDRRRPRCHPSRVRQPRGGSRNRGAGPLRRPDDPPGAGGFRSPGGDRNRGPALALRHERRRRRGVRGRPPRGPPRGPPGRPRRREGGVRGHPPQDRGRRRRHRPQRGRGGGGGHRDDADEPGRQGRRLHRRRTRAPRRRTGRRAPASRCGGRTTSGPW